MNKQELQNTIDELASTKLQIQAITNNKSQENQDELQLLHSKMRRLYLNVISNLDVFTTDFLSLKEKCISKLKQTCQAESVEFEVGDPIDIVKDGPCASLMITYTYNITLHSGNQSIDFLIKTKNARFGNQTKIPLPNCSLFPYILSRKDFKETSSTFHQTLKNVFWEIIEENLATHQLKDPDEPVLPLI